VAYDRAFPVARLEAKAGHTYIPNAVVDGNRIALYFEDKGQDFPQECLPLYRAVNEPGGNPGLAVYKTEKKCDR
jgi:hypothetical protein